MNVESKSVVTSASPEKCYDFLCDFNNFSRIIPADKVQNWSCTSDRCSFNVAGFMQLTLTFVERIPNSLVAVGPAADASTPMPFRMNVQLAHNENGTRISIAFNMEGGNPMMTMMLKPKLREAADKMADMLQYLCNAL